jgi:hypothetical protein
MKNISDDKLLPKRKVKNFKNNLNNVANSSNILLNSTILSSCFNNYSFHNPEAKIHEENWEMNELDSKEEPENFFQIPENSMGKSYSFSFKLPKNHSGKKDKDVGILSKIYKNNESSLSIISQKKYSEILDGLNDDHEMMTFKENYSKDFKEKTFDGENIISGFDREIYNFYKLESGPVEYPRTQPGGGEQFIKIQVKGFSHHQDRKGPAYHYLTDQGLCFSDKNTKTRALMIGRQQESLEGIRPNDIVLNKNDMSVSRIHCAIIYKYGFDRLRSINNSFIVFLSGKLPQSKSYVKRLPFYVLKRVYEFIKPARKIWALDLGSYVGTYKRLKLNESKSLNVGQTYIFGSDTKLLINMVFVPRWLVKKSETSFILKQNNYNNENFFLNDDGIELDMGLENEGSADGSYNGILG